MITCTQCDALFPDLLDGVYTGRAHVELKAQIARRARCRDCFAAYARTAGLCREAAQRPAAGFEARLRTALRQRLSHSPRGS